MRLATTLLLSSLSASHLAVAFNSHSTRNRHGFRSISLRQHHEPRAIFDICAYLDVDLLGEQSILGLSLGEVGHIDLCLCLSALPVYLATNVKVLAIIDILGLDVVSSLIEALVRLS